MEHDAQQLLPGIIPPQALSYLDAVRRYYGDSKTRRPPLDVDIAALLHLSGRQWQRHKHDLRYGRWGDRDWLEVWPPPFDWHPSWEPGNATGSDGETVLLVEETYSADGTFLRKRLLNPSELNSKLFGHLTTVAACVSAAFMLDLRDGVRDGIIHWCQVLLESVPHP